MGLHNQTSAIRKNTKTLTFTGAAGAGAVGTVTAFTVTGDIYIHSLVTKCTTDLTEAGATATMTLGTVNQATRFIGSTNATTIDANEFWVSTTSTAYSIDLPDAMQSVIIASGDDIIITVGSQNVDSGVLECYLLWEPLSAGASVS